MKTEKNKVFGIIDNVAAKYSTSRKGEMHTKKVHLPPAFDGEIRIDDMLEPSQFLLVSFKGTHDTFYIGIQSIAFYSEHGQQIQSFKNVAVDGETVGKHGCMPALPSNDGWIAAGDEHSLLFDFGNEVHVACVSIICTHAASTPKEVYFTDGMVQAELSGSPRYAQKSCIQLAGKAKPLDGVKFRLPSELKKKAVPCEQLMEYLNANPPARGFQSFLSNDGKDVFAFYQQGCYTTAYNYFFGKDPAFSVKFVNSLVKRRIETVVENAVKRAMTLKELQAIRTLIVSECHKKKWKSSSDGKTVLTPEHVNMHDFYSNVIKPMTNKSKYSMKEILGSSCECSPVYYVCHSWGQSVLDLIQCCEQHAVMNNLSSVEATYWISSFALRENEIGAQLNLTTSACNKALEKTKGVLLISDSNVTVANRVWVHYELIQAIDLQKPIDIAIFDEGKLKINTEYDFPHETKYHHRAREQEFPTKRITEEFLAADLWKGESSQNTDKIRILNTLCGRKDSIDDRSILNSSSKDMIESLNVVHSSLRALMARRAILSAITTDGKDLQDYFDSNLVETIKSSRDRKVVIYDYFESLESVSDEVFISLVDALGPETEVFDLNVNNCSGLTDACLKDIKFPAQLKKLKLDIGKARNISNKSLLTLAKEIPPNLEYLFLDVSGYKSPNGTYMPRFNDFLNALTLAMPGSGLNTFALNTNLDDGERSSSALLDLATSLPGRLRTFSLTLRWQGKTGALLPKLVSNLPHTIEHLSIAIKGGSYIDEGQLVQLRDQCKRLKALKNFQLTTCDDGKRGFYVIRNFNSITELKEACP